MVTLGRNHRLEVEWQTRRGKEGKGGQGGRLGQRPGGKHPASQAEVRKVRQIGPEHVRWPHLPFCHLAAV